MKFEPSPQNRILRIESSIRKSGTFVKAANSQLYPSLLIEGAEFFKSLHALDSSLCFKKSVLQDAFGYAFDRKHISWRRAPQHRSQWKSSMACRVMKACRQLKQARRQDADFLKDLPFLLDAASTDDQVQGVASPPRFELDRRIA